MMCMHSNNYEHVEDGTECCSGGVHVLNTLCAESEPIRKHGLTTFTTHVICQLHPLSEHLIVFNITNRYL